MDSKKTILVLEDETPLLGAISTKLIAEGFDVVTARTVSQGLNMLHDVPEIDAIWLDHYLLGNEDGLDFIQHLNEKVKPAKDLPIFVVTNTGSPEKETTYLKMGVKKFFTKAENPLLEIITDIKQSLEAV